MSYRLLDQKDQAIVDIVIVVFIDLTIIVRKFSLLFLLNNIFFLLSF